MFVGMKFSNPLSIDEVPIVPTAEKSAINTNNKRPAKRSQSDAKAKKRRVQPRRPRPENTHTGRWTKEEHEKFLEGIKVYGKEWKKIASMIETRTVVQIRTHAQKYFQKLAKKRTQEMKHADSAAGGGTHTAKKKTRRSQKSRAARSAPKKAPPVIPFKAMNLTLQLPSEAVMKENHRENSPTSVAELGDFPFMGSPIFTESILSNALQGDEQAIPLSNWLNDVKSDSDSNSSDTCSLGSAGHDTIYVDTRYGLESTLESYDFDGESMYSIVSLPSLLG